MLRNFEIDHRGLLKLYDECKFSGYEFDDYHELGECSIAIQIVPLCKNVLEIGGGTGKVSHVINSILTKNNIGHKHIVIEPGEGGKGNHGDIAIYKNKELFKDNYTILKKYANDLTLEDLKILDGIPDCLYVDCEGCLLSFQNTQVGKYVLTNVRYVVNEMDGYNEELRNSWKAFGFSKIAEGYGCGTSCITEVWYKD